ncbi:MAG: hypothetical protein ABIT76_07390 [Chthoniobacterales bacterium]
MDKTPKRQFHFPLSVLITESGKLQQAVADTLFAAILPRLGGASAAADFEALRETLHQEIVKQSGQGGDSGTLTQAQNDALHEMRRLASGARRSASLALKGQDVVLSGEFQIGQSETDSTLGGEVGRARKTHAASVKYATALAEEAWMASDATDFIAAIEIVAEADLAQEAALADGTKFTAAVTNAANAVYARSLRVQNACRLQWPLPRPGQTIAPETVNARSRFLVDSFPPRNKNTPDGNTPGASTSGTQV